MKCKKKYNPHTEYSKLLCILLRIAYMVVAKKYDNEGNSINLFCCCLLVLLIDLSVTYRYLINTSNERYNKLIK